MKKWTRFWIFFILRPDTKNSTTISAKPYLRTWSRCMHVLLSSKKTITGQWGDWISPQGVRVGRRSNCAQGHAYIYILGVGCPKIHPGGCRLNNGIFRCSDVHGASRVYGAPFFLLNQTHHFIPHHRFFWRKNLCVLNLSNYSTEWILFHLQKSAFCSVCVQPPASRDVRWSRRSIESR